MDWNPLIKAAVDHGVEKIVAIDVGARWGASDAWTMLGNLAEIYGFDPDIEECERLNSLSPPNIRYIPIGLGETKTQNAVLFSAREPGCSSLYKPIADVSRLLPESECISETGTSLISLDTLDNWAEDQQIPPISALKLDTQGSELGVLKGAQKSLKDVQLLEIEVEFNPLYEEQPLFGDVDRYLRSQGFVLWKLKQLVHYSNRSLNGLDMIMPDNSFYDSRPILTSCGAGQLYWAHAYYTKSEYSPSSDVPLDPSHAMRAACVACAWGFFDLAYIVLNKITEQDKNGNIGSLMKSLLQLGSEGKLPSETDGKSEIFPTVAITTLSWKAIIKAALRKILHG